jgi:cyclopropane fatty-acyl-phospholipid synthase-like methyltransferase
MQAASPIQAACAAIVPNGVSAMGARSGLSTRKGKQMSKLITVETLRRLHACTDQVKKFAELFPNGVEPTLELCVKHAADFDWSWAACNLLTASARAQYDAACASAWAQYDAACASAWAQYSPACAAAFYKAWAE